MSRTSEGEWSEEFDLIVLGAGGAGMTAALVGAIEGLKTVVLERSAEIGGTTALSSGTLWVPGYDATAGENPKAAADAADNAADAAEQAKDAAQDAAEPAKQ